MPRLSPLAAAHEAFVHSENERRSRLVADAGRGDAAAIAMVSQRAELEWIPYGPDEADAESVRLLVGAFGPFEPEYAAIRRGSALVDAFHRGTLRVSGSARRDFLNRMLTQEIGTLGAGHCRESFWLNRKGRIDADMLLVETGDEVLIDLDCFAAAPTRESLDRFLISEDAVIEDRSSSCVRLSMHGPRAASVIEAAGVRGAGAMANGTAAVGTIGAARLIRMVVARRDQCGVPGFELFIDAPSAATTATAPSAVTAVTTPTSAPAAPEAIAALAREVWDVLAASSRPIGWEAFNVARIEGGTPLFRVDFGAESLPHETSVTASRVSFRKGCYLGQEIVARMESLGAPKQQVVGFRALGDAAPVSGAQLRRPSEPMGTPIGTVTSSTVSPLARAAIGFATVRSALAAPGTKVAAHADGEAIELEVLGRPTSFLDASIVLPTSSAATATEPRSAKNSEIDP